MSLQLPHLLGYEINLLHTFRRLQIRSVSIEMWWEDLALSSSPHSLNDWPQGVINRIVPIRLDQFQQQCIELEEKSIGCVQRVCEPSGTSYQAMSNAGKAIPKHAFNLWLHHIPIKFAFISYVTYLCRPAAYPRWQMEYDWGHCSIFKASWEAFSICSHTVI